MRRARYRLPRVGCAIVALLVGCCLGVGLARAQMPEGPTRGFILPIIDKKTFKVTARIRGDVARPVGKDRDVMDLEGLSLESYDPADRTNLVVRSARCRLLVKEKRLQSEDPLDAASGDGAFVLHGRAFAWDEAQGLVVSNRVEASFTHPVEGGGAGAAAGTVRIESERFSYRDGLAVFSPDVRVRDEQGEMTCGRLSLRLAGEGGDAAAASGDVRQELREIEADERVEVRGALLAAAAAHAQYVPGSGLLVLTGDPTWQAGERSGRAGRIEIERQKRLLRAREAVRVRMPARGLVPGEGLLPGTAGVAATAGTNEWLEIRSQELDVAPVQGEPDLNTAVFRRDVVVETSGRLECGLLTVRYRESAGGEAARPDPLRASFKPVDAVAEQSVVVTQSTNRVTCVRATYGAEPALVRMAGPVAWEFNGQSGGADSMVLNAVDRSIAATGDVVLRLPAAGLGAPSRLLSVGRAERAGAGGVRERVTVPGPAEIRCASFLYTAGAVPAAAGRAAFRGGVRVTSAPALEMTADSMDADLTGGDQQVDRLTASGAVVLKSEEEGEVRSARGDEAVYTRTDQVLRLTGRDGVVLVLAGADGITEARGAEAVYDAVVDRLELRRGAEVKSARGVVTGDLVRLDLREGSVSASGLWKIRMPFGGLQGALPQLDLKKKP